MEKDNRLIAEFMGYEFTETPTCGILSGNKFTKLPKKDDKPPFVVNYGWNYPNYHKSWDWLMPVVEEIETKYCSSNIHYYSAGLIKQQYSVEFLGYNIEYGNTEYDKSKINAVYKAVIEFIKWYNKNKKDDDVDSRECTIPKK